MGAACEAYSLWFCGRGYAAILSVEKDMSEMNMPSGTPVPGVDWESGVKRLMGNEQLYRKLLSKFVSGYADAGESVRKALEAGDRQKAHEELHTLKGVAGNLSLVLLSGHVLAAEQAVKHGDADHEMELVEAMSRELEAVIRGLRACGL